MRSPTPTPLLKLTFLLFFATLSRMSFAQASTPAVQLTTHTTPIGQTVYVLDIDPQQTHIIAAHANAQIFGRSTLSQIAKTHQAIAGINGGFFRMSAPNNGFPAGILKIQDDWYGIAYHPRGAIGWNVLGQVLIDRIQTNTHLTIGERSVPIIGLNLPIGSQKNKLYSGVFGTQEVRIPRNLLGCLFNQTHVVQTFSLEDFTDSDLKQLTVKIPKDHFLYLTPEPRGWFSQDLCQLGLPTELTVGITPVFDKETRTAWEDCDFIVGGAPVLIKNHQLVRDYSAEKLNDDFVKRPHARSAVGILDNGHWVFVVADQNLLNKDPGMSIPELARFMKTLGCVMALNLDGGVSSSLYFEDRLINKPLLEREIGDAILVLLKPETLSENREIAAYHDGHSDPAVPWRPGMPFATLSNTPFTNLCPSVAPNVFANSRASLITTR